MAFEIEHCKLFRHARLDVHPEITVLVGANDVGKSVLLEAISLYGELQQVGLRDLLDDARFGGARGEPARFTAEWDVNGQRWRHSITLDSSAPEERLERGREHWSWNPKARVLDTHHGRFDARDIKRYTTMAGAEWALDTDLEKTIHEPLAVTRRFVTP
ncbi:MAG TPA: AAA family ATPase, partial [Haliangium sp.]|nr:AAA family ATPase [Haliangium sp.]